MCVCDGVYVYISTFKFSLCSPKHFDLHFCLKSLILLKLKFNIEFLPIGKKGILNFCPCSMMISAACESCPPDS